MVKFILNKKSLMTFGKWSLALFSLVLLGVFVFTYIIPILAETTPPTGTHQINVTLISPANGVYSNANTNFTYNVSWNIATANVTNCTLMGNFSSDTWQNYSWNASPLVNNKLNGINYTFGSEGVYTWNIYCYNETRGTGNYSASNRTVIIDLTYPTSPSDVYFQPDPTDSYDDDTAIILNWTAATDANSVLSYKIYISTNGSAFIYNGTNNTATGYNFTGTDGSNYTVNVTANDTAGNENMTGGLSNTTITIDTTNPSSPETISPTLVNNSYTSKNWVYVNVTFVETHPETCLLEFHNATGSNYTMTRSGTNCYLNMSSLSDGAWNYTVYVNDSARRESKNGTFYVTVDTTNPTLPSNVYFQPDPTNSYDDDTTIIVNWTASTDTNLFNYKIYISTSSGPYVYNGTNNTETGYNFTGVNSKTYRVNVTANDTAGNEDMAGGLSNTTVTVDTSNPVITSVWLVDSSGNALTKAYAGNVVVKVNVTENVGVASAEFRIRNTSDVIFNLPQWMSWTDATAETDGSSNYTSTVDAIYIPIGNWTVDVNITDNAHRSNLSYTFSNTSHVYSYAAIQATAPASTTDSTTVGGSEITFTFTVIAKGHRHVGAYVNLTAGSTRFMSTPDVNNLYIDTGTNSTDRICSIANDYTSAQTVLLPNITALPYTTANITLTQETRVYNDTVTIHINPYSGVTAGTYTGTYGWGLFSSAQ